MTTSVTSRTARSSSCCRFSIDANSNCASGRRSDTAAAICSSGGAYTRSILRSIALLRYAEFVEELGQDFVDLAGRIARCLIELDQVVIPRIFGQGPRRGTGHVPVERHYFDAVFVADRHLQWWRSVAVDALYHYGPVTYNTAEISFTCSFPGDVAVDRLVGQRLCQAGQAVSHPFSQRLPTYLYCICRSWRCDGVIFVTLAIAVSAGRSIRRYCSSVCGGTINLRFALSAAGTDARSSRCNSVAWSTLGRCFKISSSRTAWRTHEMSRSRVRFHSSNRSSRRRTSLSTCSSSRHFSTNSFRRAMLIQRSVTSRAALAADLVFSNCQMVMAKPTS